jgi:hypothetical protein
MIILRQLTYLLSHHEVYITMIELLAQKQLSAYNQNDLDTFCVCYHPQVQILDEDSRIVCQGIANFRTRYIALFTHFQCGAEVSQRIYLGSHCVDLESWWRIDLRTQERTEGKVMVRYSMSDDLISCVQFFKS